MKKTMNVLGDVLFVVVIAAVLIGSAAFALNRDPNKTLFGYRAYNVLSGSMEPTLRKGALAVVKTVTPEEIQVGDILTYHPAEQDNTTVTHRVIHTMLDGDQLMIETQGDNVEQPDPVFPAERVVGVLAFSIPYLGGIMGWCQNHLVFTVIMAVMAVTFICLIGMLLKKDDTEADPQNNP